MFLSIILTSLIVLSFLLTLIIRKYAIKKSIVDVPNERSSHTIPTPRGGGLAIVLCWYLGISILYAMDMLENSLYHAFLSGILLSIVSLIDDLVSLKSGQRFIIQIITAATALYFLGGLQLFQFQIHSSLFNLAIGIVTVIGMVWFINLYNFLDGIDAYASLQAIFVSVALYSFTGSSLCLVLIASTIGFLILNWPKAKIFMGDVGSTQLGFILIVLGIYYHNTQLLTFDIWLILTALFWFDATLTLFRRWHNKETLSQPHKKHAYQRIVQYGFSHLKTDVYAIIINALLFILAYCAYNSGIYSSLYLIAVVSILWFIVHLIDRKFLFNTDK